jgi:thiamine biosynthesis lipoprotein
MPKNTRKLIVTLLTLLALVIAFAYVRNKHNDRMQFAFGGLTMATSYSIKLIVDETISDEKLLSIQENVDAVLKRVNSEMSPFQVGSEIYDFNKSTSTSPFEVSTDFYKVLKASKYLNEISGGAFDPTIAPLINLWGFGVKKVNKHKPSDNEIQQVMKYVGFGRLKLLENNNIAKENSHLQLNLSAIAKGYAVDAIAEYLLKEGFSDFMVEVGGELYLSGRNNSKAPWHIAVQNPTINSGIGQDNIDVLALENTAVATSGDYRNFFKQGAEVFSHVFNPLTGKSERTNVASATVIANNCMLADGLATTLMVLGKEKALNLIEKIPNVEAMVIIRGRENEFEVYKSSSFANFELKK